MSIKSCPVDANGRRLLDSSTELICDRIPLTDAWKEIQFIHDIKAFSIYVNSVSAGSVALRGTIPSSKRYLTAVAVIDNGDGTVTLHSTAHGLTAGDDVTIYGTDYYDGTWTLETGTTADHIVITPDAHVLDLEGVVVADAGGGKVTIPYEDHGFNDGDSVTIANSDNYDATYTLDAASDADNIVITAVYAAETFDAGVTLTGFVTETTAVTDYAVGYADILLAASAQTHELKVVSDADTTVCSLKCATGAATGVVSLYARR